MAAVAAPTPLCPNNETAKAVAAEDARLFTKLFPIRIVVKTLSISFFNAETRFAPGILSFIICLSVIFDNDSNAVSDEEKNADAATSTTSRTAVNTILILHLLCGCALY